MPGAAVSALGDALLRSTGLVTRPAAQVFSPYTLHATLGLLALGVRGRTVPEFFTLLGAPRGSAAQLAALLARGRKMVAVADLTIASGYSAWVARGRKFSRAWRALARHATNPRLGVLDFATPTAVPSINAWAARATRGQIPTILDRLPAEADLVLASAIHFAGTWETQFRQEDTVPLPFLRLDGTASPVLTMQAQLTAGYGTDALGHAVRLGYRGGTAGTLGRGGAAAGGHWPLPRRARRVGHGGLAASPADAPEPGRGAAAEAGLCGRWEHAAGAAGRGLRSGAG